MERPSADIMIFLLADEAAGVCCLGNSAINAHGETAVFPLFVLKNGRTTVASK
jgi:hypothetical protein